MVTCKDGELSLRGNVPELFSDLITIIMAYTESDRIPQKLVEDAITLGLMEEEQRNEYMKQKIKQKIKEMFEDGKLEEE